MIFVGIRTGQSLSTLTNFSPYICNHHPILSLQNRKLFLLFNLYLIFSENFLAKVACNNFIRVRKFLQRQIKVIPFVLDLVHRLLSQNLVQFYQRTLIFVKFGYLFLTSIKSIPVEITIRESSFRFFTPSNPIKSMLKTERPRFAKLIINRIVKHCMFWRITQRFSNLVAIFIRYFVKVISSWPFRSWPNSFRFGFSSPGRVNFCELVVHSTHL